MCLQPFCHVTVPMNSRCGAKIFKTESDLSILFTLRVYQVESLSLKLRVLKRFWRASSPQAQEVLADVGVDAAGEIEVPEVALSGGVDKLAMIPLIQDRVCTQCTLDDVIKHSFNH